MYPMQQVKIGVLLVLSLSLLLAACAPATPAAQPTAAATFAPKPAEPVASATAKPAAATSVAAAPTSKPAPVKLKVGAITGGILNEVGQFVAKDKGYFAAEGLDVEFVPLQGFPDAVAPLSTGQLDAGGGGWNLGLANALRRGVDLKLVADRMSKLPGFVGYRFSVRKDLYDSGQIKTPADLKGRKIAVTSVAALGIAMVPFLKSGGLTLKDVDLVPLAVPDFLAALANKSIDAAALPEPSLTKAVDQGLAVRFADLFNFDPAPNNGVEVFSAKFASNKDLATRFMSAYIKGVRDYNDAFAKNKGKKEIIDILTKNTTVTDPALYEKMDMPGINPDGYLDKASLNWTIQYWQSTGELEGPVDIDKVSDSSFVDASVQKLGKYAR